MADRIQSGAPARPNLNALLEAARDHKMTWQDRLRQKRSWLVGNRPASDTRSAEEVLTKMREDMPELFADEMVATQAARIAELEAERDRQYDQNVEQIVYIAKLEAEVARLREALTPFADVPPDEYEGAPDDMNMSEALWANVMPEIGDLRRARAALAAPDTGGADGE